MIPTSIAHLWVSIRVIRFLPVSSGSGITDMWEPQRQFAARQPAIILVDAGAAFADKGEEERLRLFPDLADLTIQGNRALAKVVLKAVQDVCGVR